MNCPFCSHAGYVPGHQCPEGILQKFGCPSLIEADLKNPQCCRCYAHWNIHAGILCPDQCPQPVKSLPPIFSLPIGPLTIATPATITHYDLDHYKILLNDMPRSTVDKLYHFMHDTLDCRIGRLRK